jgi:hypothetical protein
MEPPPPDGERVLSILTARLLAMPASAFSDSSEAIPPVPTDELREALSDVAARSAQAAAVARLARASRDANVHFEASALAAPARTARREKLAALSGICAIPLAVALLHMKTVHEALVAACTRTDAAAADEAAHWREVATAAHEVLAAEPVGVVIFTLQAGAVANMTADDAEPTIIGSHRRWRARKLMEALASLDSVAPASSL